MRFLRTFAAATLALLCFERPAPQTVAQESVPPAELTIFDASTPVDSLRFQGVEYARDEDGALALKNDTTDPWPGVHFEGKTWDFSRYDALVLYVRSTSPEDITLYCRLDCAQSNPTTLDGVVTLSTTLKPGERQAWRVEFPAALNPAIREKLFAMRGKPGGIRTNEFSQDAKIPFDKSATTAIRPFETQNGRKDSWVLEKIVATPTAPEQLAKDDYLQWSPEQFFPFVDEFGQFKHAQWRGKTRSLEELRAQIEIENAELAAHQPSEFDQYGGWKNGPQLEATGAFRTEKVDGMWYLVDPEGRLFWSNGVDCVNSVTAVTPVSDREFYFDPSIPTSRDSNSEYAKFLSVSSRSVNNYYADKGEFLQYNLTEANLYKKFGDDWKNAWIDLSSRRLRSWGLNTIGNWSSLEVCARAKTPYTATVSSGGPSIEGSKGYWGKFVDPFDPAFARSVRSSLEAIRAQTADDPYCIGYFVDNEISWGEKGSLARAALLSPASQKVKQAYLKWLQEKYETIDAFNAAWQVDLKDWQALLDEPFETPQNENAENDSNAFYVVICEKYFSQILEIVRELAPKKLYLGCRFAWNNDLARAAGQKYCDVVSYNFYKSSVADFKPVEGAPDKPVVIGEFHFGALDRGLFHTGLCPCKDQNARAQAYEDYVKSALSNPWIVGAHWFEYQDEAVTGRFDGENYQIGLVDVCDRPYEETIQAVRRVGYNLYQIRKNASQQR